ncbi:hypothetical protein KDH_06400 [Dictyobacter sp. S3.2.2.5]|uniref:NB-ARC domain-containing protein n=2 Tax=Dictyobacter halimunensis TaxID=3026934 RepID=A0ABQ6FLU9_9CHLR|nr:hypothetical protein KDH_06400 [Dictyobacter sp. S3.2.2.5]
MARLEAGRLVYPFRGHVRRQVLALAWLLCSTSREVQTYLQVASLKDLNVEEDKWVQQLYAHVSGRAHPSIELLPARPQHLIGRDALVQEIVDQLCSLEHGVCALTGMPGIGKSAVASVVVHHLVAEGYSRVFHQGIITISCKGRRGTRGLLSVLHEVIRLLSPSQKHDVPEQSDGTLPFWLDHMDIHLSGLIDQVRILLMDKSILFLLDDLDAQFPLRTALDALLGSTRHNAVHPTEHRQGVARHVVLTTSRHIPSPTFLSYHHHLQPLMHHNACALLYSLSSSTCATAPLALHAEEQEQATARICDALGNHPLAIELAANSVVGRGIPLDLLATNIALDPFHPVLDNNGELGALFEHAFSNIGHEQQQHFALLALLGPQAFSLESAAALIQSEQWEQLESFSCLISARPGQRATAELERLPDPDNQRKGSAEMTRADNPYVSFQTLTSTALELGYLVNDSLLERVGPDDRYSSSDEQLYQLHPLLYAYARNRVQRLPASYLDAVWSNFQAYMTCFYK